MGVRVPIVMMMPWRFESNSVWPHGSRPVAGQTNRHVSSAPVLRGKGLLSEMNFEVLQEGARLPEAVS